MKFGIWACVALLSLVPTRGSCAAEGQFHQLPTEVTDAALSPETGDVAIANAEADQVWILPAERFEDSNVEPVGPLPSTIKPIAVLFKRYQQRSYLVVGCFDSQGVHVFDAATRTIVARLPQDPGSLPIAVSASENPEDPWIYVTRTDGNRQRLDAFRIDKTEPQWEQMEPPQSVSPASETFATSSSGRLLYGVDTKHRTIRQWVISRPETAAGAPTARYAARTIAPEVEQPLVRLPLEQGIAQGNSYWLPNLRRSPDALPVRAACGVRARPFLFGLAGQRLSAVSLVTGKKVFETDVPFELELTRERTLSLQFREQIYQRRVHPIVLVDSERERVAVFADRHAYVMGPASLALPDEPVLVSLLDVPESVTVGDELAVDLQLAGPRVETRLTRVPEGMRISDGKVLWRPEYSQLGLNKFVVERRHADAAVRQEIEVVVRPETLKNPFLATHATLDSTGTRLVAWRSRIPTQISVTDLVTRETIVQRDAANQVLAASLAEETLYLLCAEHRRASLLLLDAETLQTKSEHMLDERHDATLLHDAMIAVSGDAVLLYTEKSIIHRFLFSDLKDSASDGQPRPGVVSNGLLTDPLGFICPARGQPSRPLGTAPPQRQARLSFRSRELRSASEYKERPTAVAPESYPVRLSIELVHDSTPGLTRIDLVAKSSIRNESLHRWPIRSIETANPTGDLHVFWSVNGSKAACVIEESVYVKDLNDLNALSDVMRHRPFRLQSQDDVLAVDLKKEMRLQYTLTGGQQPYNCQLVLPVAAGTAPASDWVAAVPDVEGAFNINIAAYVRHQRAKTAESLTRWAERTAPADVIMTEYAQSVGEAYKTIVGKMPEGVPLAIPVIFLAREAQGETQQLHHYLLVDVPKEMLTLHLNDAVAKRWPETAVGIEAEARAMAIRSKQPSPALLRFSLVTQRGKPTKTTPEELNAAADDALGVIERGWQQTLDRKRQEKARYPLRKWTDTEGNTVIAKFDRIFAGQVFLGLQAGTAVTFAIEKLCEADQQYVRDATAEPDPDELAARDVALVRQAQLAQIVLAAHRFHGVHRMFPPSATVDEDGQRLLSWRVHLLPFLGGEKLYRLFRLDEPWDSEHNMRLANYMPSIYRVADLQADDTRTPITRLTGSQTLAPLNAITAFRDVIDGTANTLFAAIVAEERAVVWTKPDDLSVDEAGEFSQQLWWHEGKALVAMCDGSVHSIAKATSAEAWKNGAIRNDGQPLRLIGD